MDVEGCGNCTCDVGLFGICGIGPDPNALKSANAFEVLSPAKVGTAPRFGWSALLFVSVSVVSGLVGAVVVVVPNTVSNEKGLSCS